MLAVSWLTRSCRYNLIVLFALSFFQRLIVSHDLQSGTPDIDMESQYDDILRRHKLVFLYTYADWCRFTPLVTPIFESFAQRLKSELRSGDLNNQGITSNIDGEAWNENDIFVGRVNYDRNQRRCNELSITKFPTFKLYRYGEMSNREYRGERSVQAFSSFLKTEMKSPLILLQPDEQPFNLTKRDRLIFGHFRDRDSPLFAEFKKIAFILRDNCDFFLTDNSQSGPVATDDKLFLGYSKNKTLVPLGTDDITDLATRARSFCTPILRVMTLENIEDLLEFGRPLLALLEQPQGSPVERDTFEQIVTHPELRHFQDKFTFVYTNGTFFKSILGTLGKSMNDLPFVVLDDLRHMYDFPGNLSNWQDMKAFYDRFFSNALHQELHRKQAEEMRKRLQQLPGEFLLFPHIQFKLMDLGEAGARKSDGVLPRIETGSNVGEGEPEGTVDGQPHEDNRGMDPRDEPESVLRRLAPSSYRYTRLKDEL